VHSCEYRMNESARGCTSVLRVHTGRLCTLLIRHGAHVEARDSLLSETPLHKAVRSNAIDNVAALIAFASARSRKLLRATDVTGNTALHKAAALPVTDLAVWNMLLAADGAADVARTTNVDGLTVLQVAQRAKNSLALALLRALDAHAPAN